MFIILLLHLIRVKANNKNPKNVKKIIISLFLLLLIQQIFAQSEKYSRVKILTQNKLEIETIAALGIALDGLQLKPGSYIIGEFSSNELILLKDSGFEFEILIDDLTEYYLVRNKGVDIKQVNSKIKASPKVVNGYKTPSNFKLGSMGGYHTYQELLDELDEMREQFPNLISEKNTIGSTTTIQGRPVYWVRISNNPNQDQEKPKVLYTSLTHAREPASMQQMLYQMWYYLENYSTNPEIKYLVDNIEMFFIPCVNPDGYIYNQSISPNGGGLWRKNRRVNGDGSMGVDLNRNFGYQWGFDNTGSSPIGSSETYRGTGAFSEPETQLIKQFCEEREISLALNNHTYSDILIYPWGYNSTLTPDAEVFIEYAKLLTFENKYVYGTCFETLNYTANGGSDDWFYGEQQTKNKIMAFTPEAGKPSDGFWPQISRIEEICAGHTSMNLYMARFALAYANILDKTPPFISEENSSFSFEIMCLGIDTPSIFTISLEPISSNIISVGEPATFSGMKILQTASGSINISINPSAEVGEQVRFAVHVDNGSFTRTDTITKIFGEMDILFESSCDNLTGWTSTSWGSTTQNYHSSPASITDSPLGQYLSNSNTYIELVQEIDLKGTLQAYVEFMTMWSIEPSWDYAQFMVSSNGGTTWVPLAGEYTAIGGQYQDVGKPVYHGKQAQWVKERISLNSHLGNKLKFRFRLISDSHVNDDGFYFDDFKVITMPDPAYSSINDVPGNSETVSLHFSRISSEITASWTNTKSFQKVELIDIQGRVVYSSPLKGITTFSIPASHLSHGVYIVRLSGRETFSGKIVK